MQWSLFLRGKLIINMKRLFFIFILFCSFFGASASMHALPPTLPIEEIKPGMRGKTLTVMQGTEIVELETEILGVQWGGADAGRHLIIGKLIDSKTSLTQAVHGMSGSPLYINGKLAGALSRRITIAEKDGHCAFTPISDMLEVMQRPSVAPSERAEALSPKSFAFGEDLRVATKNWVSQMHPNAGGFSHLSLPWTVTGWNESWRPVLERFWNKNTLMSPLAISAGSTGSKVNPSASFGASDPSGSSSQLGFKPKNPGELLKPGSSLSVVLVEGDITVASTGTLTWIEGNEFIGFGHPMLEFGKVNLPVAPAEVVTVVPSYLMPYKLANAGPIAGTLEQDRLSAVSGKVGGSLPPMAKYNIKRTHEKQSPQTFSGRFVVDQRLVPMLFSTFLSFSFLDQQNISTDFWTQTHGEIEFEKLNSFKWNMVASGRMDARYELIYGLAGALADLYQQYGDQLKIKSLTIDLKTIEEAKVWRLVDLRTDKLEYHPNEKVRVECVVENLKGERETLHAELELPEEIQLGSVTLSLLDAHVLASKEFENRKTEEKSVSRAIELLNLSFDEESLYLQLSTAAKGVSVRGKENPLLPASVLEIMKGISPRPYMNDLNEKNWLRTSLSCNGVVSGEKTLQLEIVPRNPSR